MAKTAKTNTGTGTAAPAGSSRFNVVVVGQAGRLGYEALLFVSSLRQHDPGFKGRVIVAEPQPGPRWTRDPRMSDELRETLLRLDAEVCPFDADCFGSSYPEGNKIHALAALPPGEPFVFFDSDTVVTGRLSHLPFDFSRPSASMNREGTWPKIELYGPGYGAIWRALYDRFGLDFESSLDLSQPDEYWERYLYFNAGWFFHEDPLAFHDRFLSTALSIRDTPPDALVCQELYPWLDQIALPLVIHGLGGGRPGPELAGLDGDVTCHWRVLPLAYARESDDTIEALEAAAAPNKVKKVLKNHEPMLRMIYQGRGRKVRDLFDRNDLPRQEKTLRNRIKREGFWMR